MGAQRSPPAAAATTLAIARAAHDALCAPKHSNRARAAAAVRRWRERFDRDPALLGASHQTAAERLARVHESLIGAAQSRQRRSRGVHYTPADLIDRVLDEAFTPVLDAVVRSAGLHATARANALLAVRVLDPACGTGLFLMAAARRIAERWSRAARCDAAEALRIVTLWCLRGIDIDPHAARACRALLRLHAGLPPNDRDALDRALIAADALALGPSGVARRLLGKQHARGFDAVIGNPPFLSPLLRRTGRSAAAARRLAAWSGGAIKRYADSAAAFWLLSARLMGADGRAGLVLPRSILTTTDARPVRDAIAQACAVVSVWVSPHRAFAASVHTIAATIAREPSGGRGVSPAPSLDGSESWGALAASGVPDSLRAREFSPPKDGPTLAHIAHATADFRDAYYGLKGCVVEAGASARHADAGRAALAPVITSGLIDLVHCAWGDRAVRLHGRVLTAPAAHVEHADADPFMARWRRLRQVPKVLLAMQTRVIEAVVDDRGAWLPCTPVVTLTARDDGPLAAEPLDVRLWLIAGALCSPWCCAIAHRQYAGSALSPDAIKLSARQALGLPIPAWHNAGARRAWRAAAHALRRAERYARTGEAAPRAAALRAFAAHMDRAHALTGDDARRVRAWWLQRVLAVEARRAGTKATTISRSRGRNSVVE